MDLKPIYQLRTRLYAATMAGTQLIMEDYRLKRAVEELQPLEKASPVFARIAALGKQLFSPDCNNREGVLLDAIILTDAVLCTQGVVAVTGTVEELEDVIDYKGENSIQNIPYSILHNLIESLTGSGSGRYAFVGSLHTTHPQYFKDYRVQTAMIKALSDSYAELADVAAKWIRESGPSIVPLLKKGFKQNTTKAMVRIVQLIEEFCGAQENAFYLEKLPESEKNVRGALIFALRHAKENTETLINLARTEKASTKKMAYWALAEMEGPEVEEFWNTFYKKKPKDAISYLAWSETDWASNMVAKEFNRLVEPWTAKDTPKILTKETIEEIENTIWKLKGKTGAAVCECYRQAMRIGGLLAECKKFWYNYSYYEAQEANQIKSTQKGKELYYSMAQILQTTLLQCQDKELGELAIEFYETYGEAYFPAAATAKLLEDTGDTIDWMTQQLKEEKVSKEFFVKALEYIFWDEEKQSYVLKLIRTHNADDRDWEVKTPIQAVLDEDTWIEFLMERFGRKFTQKQINYAMDCVMSKWIRSEDTEYCKKLTEYYYKKAVYLEDNESYLPLLQMCHAKECAGIAVRHFKGKETSIWQIENYFGRLSGTVENKEKEARAVYDLLISKEIKLRYRMTTEQLENCKEDCIQKWAYGR